MFWLKDKKRALEALILTIGLVSIAVLIPPPTDLSNPWMLLGLPIVAIIYYFIY
jgi:hypothetical protein